MGYLEKGFVSLKLESVEGPEKVFNETFTGEDEFFIFRVVGHLFACFDYHLTIDHIVVDFSHAQDRHRIVKVLVIGT